MNRFSYNVPIYILSELRKGPKFGEDLETLLDRAICVQTKLALNFLPLDEHMRNHIWKTTSLYVEL